MSTTDPGTFLYISIGGGYRLYACASDADSGTAVIAFTLAAQLFVCRYALSALPTTVTTLTPGGANCSGAVLAMTAPSSLYQSPELSSGGRYLTVVDQANLLLTVIDVAACIANSLPCTSQLAPPPTIPNYAVSDASGNLIVDGPNSLYEYHYAMGSSPSVAATVTTNRVAMAGGIDATSGYSYTSFGSGEVWRIPTGTFQLGSAQTLEGMCNASASQQRVAILRSGFAVLFCITTTGTWVTSMRTRYDCSNATDCTSVPPCGWANCTAGRDCAYEVACDSAHCFDEACEVCANATGDCPSVPPCGWANCTVGHACSYSAPCDPAHCIDGSCKTCVDAASDCLEVPPCGWANCTAGHTCAYAVACNVSHCYGDECRPCVNATQDCHAVPPCGHASCTAGHVCSYSTSCDPVHCIDEVCVQCVNATADCHDAPPCGLANCTIDRTCSYSELCNASECFGDACIQAAASSGMAHRNCVHALGWWYAHALDAFAPIAPVAIGGGAIVVTDAATMRLLLQQGHGPNGLSLLAAVLLVADANALYGAAAPPTLITAMTNADQTLGDCPPSTWPSMHASGRCGVHTLARLMMDTVLLMDYATGRYGIPLCPDIGVHH
jgi:hypothetical protein